MLVLEKGQFASRYRLKFFRANLPNPAHIGDADTRDGSFIVRFLSDHAPDRDPFSSSLSRLGVSRPMWQVLR